MVTFTAPPPAEEVTVSFASHAAACTGAT